MHVSRNFQQIIIDLHRVLQSNSTTTPPGRAQSQLLERGGAFHGGYESGSLQNVFQDRDDMDPRVGLCSVCRHVKRVETGSGRVYYLCRLSATDERFNKYPQLPMRSCPGFEESGGRDPS